MAQQEEHSYVLLLPEFYWNPVTSTQTQQVRFWLVFFPTNEAGFSLSGPKRNVAPPADQIDMTPEVWNKVWICAYFH